MAASPHGPGTPAEITRRRPGSPRAAAIRRALDAAEIEWRHYYPRPMYREAAFGADALPPGACPEAERACEESISIPIYPRLPAASIERVCEVIRDAVGA